MEQKIKNCKKCEAQFSIEKEDEDFYSKMNVPHPTLCPTCRMQRKMCFRNERTLYKAKCAFSNQDMLSVYPPTTKYIVYEQKIWWSDKWNALDYGVDFDFNRPFFEQFEELCLKVPKINLDNRANENSDYCNDTSQLKNSYLCFNSEQSQDFYYCTTSAYGRDCMDMFWALQCELCYECTKITGGYHCFYCFNSSNVSDCFFCEDLVGCKNCFGCVGLHHKEYCLFNEQLSREQYEKFTNNFKFTYEDIQDSKRKLEELRLTVQHKNLEIDNSENCLGDYISNSKNCAYCFDVMESQDCKYVWDGMMNTGYDCFNTGLDSSFIYESVGVYRANNVKFCNKCSQMNDVLYCDYCYKLSNCFGCTNLNYNEYCILNKKYTREEYEKLLPRIIEHMKKTGEWGEFFNSKISTIGYNSSMAQYYFPLDKATAESQGFNWEDYERPKTELKSTKAKDLPNDISEVNGDILNATIECEKDGKPFKIIPQELKFYKKHGLALPHLCHDCRHFERKGKMNPRKLYDRKCMKCGTEMQTTYSPDRKEIVYCEKCYLEQI